MKKTKNEKGEGQQKNEIIYIQEQKSKAEKKEFFEKNKG